MAFLDFFHEATDSNWLPPIAVNEAFHTRQLLLPSQVASSDQLVAAKNLSIVSNESCHITLQHAHITSLFQCYSSLCKDQKSVMERESSILKIKKSKKNITYLLSKEQTSNLEYIK